MPLPQTALLAIMITGRRRTGRQRHHQHHGLLQHAFATSPWLGAIGVTLVVLVGMALALMKKAGRLLEGTPWYVRLALLATAGAAVFRLLNRRNQTTSQDYWEMPDGRRPGPPWDRAG